jgi:hypothetical protein
MNSHTNCKFIYYVSFTILEPFIYRTQGNQFKNFHNTVKHNSMKKSFKNIKTEFSSPRLRVKSVRNEPSEDSIEKPEKFSISKKDIVTERKGVS